MTFRRLQDHLNTHKGDKPYQCQQCHKAFTYKDNLRRYILERGPIIAIDLGKHLQSYCLFKFIQYPMLRKSRMNVRIVTNNLCPEVI